MNIFRLGQKTPGEKFGLPVVCLSANDEVTPSSRLNHPGHREGHFSDECYANTDVYGNYLQT